MLRANVRNIAGVLFTHEHADHVAGLDDLRPFSFQLGAVPVYGQERVLTTLATRFDYIFNDQNKYPGAPSVKKNVLDNSPFQLGEKWIVPVLVNHGNLKIFGYRIDDFAYLTDVKSLDDPEKKKLMNLDVLVISAIRHKAHRSHLNLEEALVLIDELKPKMCYLTHISQYLGFHDEVERELPAHVKLAYDGLELVLKKK
jgi:phosphoribosyl 1,2-cyclic phosphate phosphodiesterase